MSNRFPKTEALCAAWKPKTGKNKHWAYKHIDELTPDEIEQGNAHWAVS